VRADNYVGLAVHTAARISASAHGGQTVASGDTRDALEGSTRDGIRLRSIGTHRLRGIPDAVALYQIVAPGLPKKFPALRI
jgi:class 3 adenylate cyclase